jgi:hypothetical protein
LSEGTIDWILELRARLVCRRLLGLAFVEQSGWIILSRRAFPTDRHPHCYLHAVKRIGGKFQKPFFGWRTDSNNLNEKKPKNNK